MTAGAGALAAWAVACGLPLSGLGAAADGGSPSADVSSETPAAVNESGPPPACTSLDAACLGPLPSGWQAIALTDAGCAPGFTAAHLVMNPRVEDGGCACGGCRVIGSYDCEGTVAISGGDGCNDPTLVDAAPGTCTPASAQHVEAHPTQATGNVGCFASNDAGTGVTADPLGICVPGCSADYCASSSRCIVAEGTVPCPTGFTLLGLAGTGAEPGCAPCSCTSSAPGDCAGTVTVFDDPACADVDSSATYAMGTCNQYTTTGDYQSLRVDLVPPDASCAASIAAGTADASLVEPRTVCCQ
jgi:hypothetical protein